VVRLACDLINEWLLDARRRVSAEEGIGDRRVKIVVVLGHPKIFFVFGYFSVMYTMVRQAGDFDSENP
jgi:hypothetical protein